MEAITESMNIQKEWYELAKKQTVETLPDFIKNLIENYSHDYGTICHAVAASAIGAAWSVNNHKNGGITGFQGGAVMWQFVREWNYSSNKTGLKITDYDNFLFPQYEDKFQKVMSASVFKNLQNTAKEKMDEADKENVKYLSDLAQYETDLAAFKVKYPDYETNPKHYERIEMGTWEEHEAEKKKVESGFEFAPQKPYCVVDKNGRVYKHWQSIIEGFIPFGYSISED